MRTIDEPVFCMTTDTDWASDWALEALFAIFDRFGVRPTLFATHRSPFLDRFVAETRGEIGIHPAFVPGSDHGDDYDSVLETVCGWYPMARCWRAHRGYESSDTAIRLWARGFRYQSNVLYFLQPNLVPLRHACDMTCLPCFWEDDVHWFNTDGDWDLGRWLPAFLTPGLKILNVHAFFTAANVPDAATYRRLKPHITTLDAASARELRHPGRGCADFLVDLLEAITARGHRFHTLGELYEAYPVEDFLAPGVPNPSPARRGGAA